MVNALLLVLAASGPLQDPTQPLAITPTLPVGQVSAAPAAPKLELQAVFSGAQGSAIINNGQRYQVGQTVQNFKVQRITSSEVLLQGPHQTLTLTLFPSLSTPSNR